MISDNGKTDVAPALLALDWGTSSLRAFLMDRSGKVMAQRANAHGIQNLPKPGVPGFEMAFTDLCGDWIGRWKGLPVVAGGMVGSAQGWKEAPYVVCPADTHVLATRAVSVDSGHGFSILIAPGVLYDPVDAAPDVIRGEEIQIAGALTQHPSWSRQACIALPGTHSKWVQIVDGRIVQFATYMTGELFALLSQHSILARLMPESGPADADEADAAFVKGIGEAQKSHPGDLPHQLFTTRSLGLTHRLSNAVLKDYLSGLLIGHELVSGLNRMRGSLTNDTPLLLIGEALLCQRYARALAVLGVIPTALLENTAPQGLFRFAVAAGFVTPSAKDE
jgi:2-dehydro-3-deoxygalactonokinase